MEALVACMTKSKVDMLPLCACLEACVEERPYREVEKELALRPIMRRSNQTPHVLIGLLVEAGGIERIEVPEDEAEAEAAGAQGASAGSTSSAGDANADPLADVPEVQEEAPDLPIDYQLKTTELGRAALKMFDADLMLSHLLSSEPEEFRAAYCTVLSCCKGGASLSEVRSAIGATKVVAAQGGADGKAKSVYPEYFVSKLETAGALLWDAAWQTTESGLRALATLEGK